MSDTLAVLKPLRSSEVSALQPSNICPISVTLVVLKVLKSKEGKAVSLNISFMSVTLDGIFEAAHVQRCQGFTLLKHGTHLRQALAVLKLLQIQCGKGTTQLRNISCMSVIFSVLKLLKSNDSQGST